MIKQLKEKIIYTSVQKSELPQNLEQFRCDLIEVQNIKNNTTKKYLQFTHRKGTQPNFKIKLVSFKRPSVLMHVYKLQPEKFDLKGQIGYIAEPIVERKKKQFTIKQDKEESEDQYTEKKIILNQSSNSDNSYDSQDEYSQSSNQGLAPSKQKQGKIKLSIIQILQKNQKISSIKEINKRLKKDYDIKIPQKIIKEIIIKVCVDGQKKSKSYVLKPQFVVNVQDQIKKKVKQE